MLNLHHLRYFYVCAQMGSVTKAAHKLGISQPSLSAQLKRFEENIGMQVLSRSGRAIVLTPRGRDLFEYSSRLFEVSEQIDRYITKSDQIKEFDLRIGVGAEVERPFIAEVLGRLMKIHGAKKISSTILSGAYEEIVTMLSEDQVDVIVTNRKVPGPTLIAEMNIPVILVSASDADSVRANSSNIQGTLERLGQSLILPLPQMTLGRETREYLKKIGIRSFTSLQTNILACIVRAVEEGVGAAFLPVAYVNVQIKKGIVRAYGPHDGFWRHTVFVYSLKGKSNPFFNDLVKILNDLAALT